MNAHVTGRRRSTALLVATATAATLIAMSAFSHPAADTLPGSPQAALPMRQAPLADLRLFLVPAGSAILGDRTGADADAPPRQVTFAKPFWIGECEVSQAQWRVVMGAEPSVARGDDLPVERVSHDDCREFLRRLAMRDGRAYRLPSADEWEYARRAGSSALAVADEERLFARAAAT